MKTKEKNGNREIIKRIGEIAGALLIIPELIIIIKNKEIMTLLNMIWDNITLILFIIGIIWIIFIIVKRFITIKYNQKANNSEIPDISGKADKKQIESLIDTVNSQIESLIDTVNSLIEKTESNFEKLDTFKKDICSSGLEKTKKRLDNNEYILQSNFKKYEHN